MINPESKKIERFIWGLTQLTKGNVLAAKPDTYDSAKCLAQTLIDHSDHLEEAATTPDPTERSGAKRKSWNKKHSQLSKESSKKQQTVPIRAATVPVVVSAVGSKAQTPTSRYAGTLPPCNKCNYHHLTSSPCREVFCNICGKKGHIVKNCKTPTQSTNQASRAGISPACYGCGEVGHFKRNCPKTATTGNTGRVQAIGQVEAAADSTVATVGFSTFWSKRFRS
ncbi:hypothetical protein Lser_V15G18833 [Lactuca serriola]